MTTERLIHGKKPSPFAHPGTIFKVIMAPELSKGSLKTAAPSHLFPNPVLLPSSSYQSLSKASPSHLLLAILLLRDHYQETQLMIHDQLLPSPVLSCLQSQGLDLESTGTAVFSLSSLPLHLLCMTKPREVRAFLTTGGPNAISKLLSLSSTSSPTANPLILWVFLLGIVSVPSREHLIGPAQLFKSSHLLGQTNQETGLTCVRDAPPVRSAVLIGIGVGKLRL